MFARIAPRQLVSLATFYVDHAGRKLYGNWNDEMGHDER